MNDPLDPLFLFASTVTVVFVTALALALGYSTVATIGGVACFALATLLFMRTPS